MYSKRSQIVLYSILILMVFGCNDFLDVNEDPTKVSESEVTLEALLPTVIEATSESHYSTIYSASRVTHQLDHVSGYYSEFTMDANWSRIYLESLNTLDLMVAKADASESPHYKGIARVLQALNMGMLTDSWEDAPIQEALKGSEAITPTYNSQEEIYELLFSYLEEGITALEAEESFFEPGDDDMVYGGDLLKWVRLAHSLKARYMLHLYGKGTFTASQILAEVAAGMQSNEDNFSLTYNDVNLNPIHSNVALANETGNFTVTHGKYLVDVMNGRLFGVFDPRLPIIADTTGSGGATYEGLATYDIGSPVHTCEMTTSTWYASSSAPVIMMSYAELKFIEAEVALPTDNARAYAAYRAGITSNLDMLEVDRDAADAYMADPLVDLGGTVDLEHIMKEKYVALFLSFEVWNDMRRHDFSSDVFVGFIAPEWESRDGPAYRAMYPTSELSRNGVNVSTHVRDITETMWKDL